MILPPGGTEALYKPIHNFGFTTITVLISWQARFIYANPLTDSNKIVLLDSTRYPLHVSMNDGASNHYAATYFDLFSRNIEIPEGSHGVTMKHRGQSWKRDALSILTQQCYLIDDSTTNVEDEGWAIIQNPSLVHQEDVVNCGPIACATLQMLLISDDDFKIFNNLRQMVCIISSDSNASLFCKFNEDDYLNLFNEYNEKIYVPVTKKWIQSNYTRHEES